MIENASWHTLSDEMNSSIILQTNPTLLQDKLGRTILPSDNSNGVLPSSLMESSPVNQNLGNIGTDVDSTPSPSMTKDDFHVTRNLDNGVEDHQECSKLFDQDKRVAKLMLGQVYCLRCQNCKLMTIQMSKFITHAPKCPGLTKHAKEYQCYVYWCSKCHAISTEKDLIDEHIITAHSESDQAKIIREQLSVSKSSNEDSTEFSTSPNTLNATKHDLQAVDSSTPFQNRHRTHEQSGEFEEDDDDEIGSNDEEMISSDDTNSRPRNFKRGPDTEDFKKKAPRPSLAKIPKIDTDSLNFNTSQPFNLQDAAQSMLSALNNMSGFAGPDTNKALLAMLTNMAAVKNPNLSLGLNLPLNNQLVESSMHLEFEEQWSEELPETLIRTLRSVKDFELQRWTTDNSYHCIKCQNYACEELDMMKMHVLTVHMAVPQKYVNMCLRYIGPNSQASSPNSQRMKHSSGSNGKRYLLRYSRNALSELSVGVSQATKEDLQRKMELYATKAIIAESKSNYKRFVCESCGYASNNALSDVRKHILNVHCNVDARWTKICLQASRVDTTTFRLLSDKKLLYHWKYTRDIGLNGRPGSPRSVSSNDWGQNEENRPHEESITLDKADDISEIVLPFSRNVLRQLIAGTGALEETVDDMERRMNIYSNYKITHYLRNGRSIAFKCPCGRIFYTVKQPESTMRPATLADCRRHIMSVHAKIPGEFVTLCCQASRISRENDFELLPEESLLKMAIERPLKTTQKPILTSLPSFVNNPPPAPIASPKVSVSSSGIDMKPVLSSLKDTLAGNILSNLNLQNFGNMGMSLLQASGLSNFDSSSILEASNSSLFADNPLSGTPVHSSKRDGTNSKSTTSNNVKEDPEDEFPVLETWSDLENAIHPGLVNVDAHYDPISCLRKAQNSSDVEIEKIIDLPFSEDALRYLVKGYCPDEFFDLLLEKMNIYGAHKVYITRKLGRRYFCCSGCPAKSPHGMGDMRKHIFGVHAKISERYKAAAMHCSRLSREDSSLLPYQSLIHLAKMRWKGTNIKSLSELEARLAYNQRMALLQQNTGISNSPQDSSTSNNNNSTFNGKLAAVIVNGDKYKCSLCQAKKSDEKTVKHHILVDHLHIKGAFKCPICSEQSFDSEKDVRDHYHEIHPGMGDLSEVPVSDLYQLSLKTILVQKLENAPTITPNTNSLNLNFANLMDWQASLAQLNLPFTSTFHGLFPQNAEVALTLNTGDDDINLVSQPSSNQSSEDSSSSRRRKPAKSELVQIKNETRTGPLIGFSNNSSRGSNPETPDVENEIYDTKSAIIDSV